MVRAMTTHPVDVECLRHRLPLEYQPSNAPMSLRAKATEFRSYRYINETSPMNDYLLGSISCNGVDLRRLVRLGIPTPIGAPTFVMRF